MSHLPTKRNIALLVTGLLLSTLLTHSVSGKQTGLDSGNTTTNTLTVHGYQAGSNAVYLPLIANGSGENVLAAVESTIPDAGGTVVLPNYATTIFPPNSLPGGGVKLEAITSLAVEEEFTDTAVLDSPDFSPKYYVRLSIGTTLLKSEATIVFNIPELVQKEVPAGSSLEVFALIEQGGDEEMLNTFLLTPSTYNASTKTLTVPLTEILFTNRRSSDGIYQTMFAIVSTPGASIYNKATLAEGSCKGTTIGSPLTEPLVVTSAYGGRLHPIEKKIKGHAGVDLRANGVPVVAAASGKVTISKYNINAKGVGYGHYVVIEHDGGAQTLYGHLEKGTLPKVGTKVNKGDKIGVADSSGGVSGPHLHFEYAPKGDLFGKGRVDPMPCIGATVNSSITVRDNGAVADDAFSVALNGTVLGQTDIGASNNFAIGSLIPGSYKLTITAVIAPDNIGTMAVSLADGLTFADGSTKKSASLKAGQSIDYTIVVPTK